MNLSNLPEFHAAYVECALWSSHDVGENGETTELDSYEPSTEFLASAMEDCRAFIESNADDLATLDAGQSGHDFWLTRNGHGAGFWDRGYGELGDRLADASRVYGGCDLHLGADDLVYAS